MQEPPSPMLVVEQKESSKHVVGNGVDTCSGDNILGIFCGFFVDFWGIFWRFVGDCLGIFWVFFGDFLVIFCDCFWNIYL